MAPKFKRPETVDNPEFLNALVVLESEYKAIKQRISDLNKLMDEKTGIIKHIESVREETDKNIAGALEHIAKTEEINEKLLEAISEVKSKDPSKMLENAAQEYEKKLSGMSEKLATAKDIHAQLKKHLGDTKNAITEIKAGTTRAKQRLAEHSKQHMEVLALTTTLTKVLDDFKARLSSLEGNLKQTMLYCKEGGAKVKHATTRISFLKDYVLNQTVDKLRTDIATYKEIHEARTAEALEVQKEISSLREQLRAKSSSKPVITMTAADLSSAMSVKLGEGAGWDAVNQRAKELEARVIATVSRSSSPPSNGDASKTCPASGDNGFEDPNAFEAAPPSAHPVEVCDASC